MENSEMETVGGEGGLESELSSEAAYEFLSDRRRRYALHYLKQRQEPVSVRELAEQVAAWENEKEIDQLASQERKRVYISLYQSHLPTMDKQGIVSYDPDDGTVTLAESLSSADIYLEVVPKEDIPWNVYYLGLAAADGLLLALARFEVAPFDLVPDLAWGGIVLVTFAASAFVQTYLNRRMRFGDEGPPPELR